jgi:hypothetical protein
MEWILVMPSRSAWQFNYITKKEYSLYGSHKWDYVNIWHVLTLLRCACIHSLYVYFILMTSIQRHTFHSNYNIHYLPSLWPRMSNLSDLRQVQQGHFMLCLVYMDRRVYESSLPSALLYSPLLITLSFLEAGRRGRDRG